MREYTDLSGSFHETLFDGGEKNVSLPVVMPFEKAPSELCLECTFTPPEDTEQNCFFIELDSLSAKYDIFCNGEKVTSLKSVYTRRRAELTAHIRQNAANEIRLVISPLKRADGRFSFGGARILMTDKTHFELLSDGDSGISVRTLINGLAAHVSVKAEIINPNNYDVAVFTLYDPNGRVIETRTEKPTAAQTDFSQDAPELWDGPHSPAVYTVEAAIQRDSVILDKVSCTFGIRSFEINPDGFFCVNGIKNPLCGITLADFDQIEDDMEAVSELDANCVRFTGLPVDDDILTRCDEAGVLAWIDLPSNGTDSDLDELRAAAKAAAMHPSAAVISTTAKDPAFAKSWCSTVKQYAQYTSPALFSDIFDTEGIIDAVPEILAVTIPADTGLNDFTKYENRLAEIRELHPEFRLAVFAASPECIIDRHSENARRSDCSQEFFSAWHERFWNTFCSQKNVIGVFGGYLSDRDNATNRTGLVTLDREEKKDAFWFYRAQFSATGFVRLCSSGQTLVTSKYTDIKCYSNTSAVKLTVNGKENKNCGCEKLSDCVYVFRNIKLKRRNNTVVVTSGSSTDSEVIFRSRSRLSKK